MESFFTRHAHARWPKSGLLHVYVLPPDDAVATMATAYQDRLRERGLTNLSHQPGRWLHLSVERVNAHADELTSRQLTTLTEALPQCPVSECLRTEPSRDVGVADYAAYVLD